MIFDPKEELLPPVSIPNSVDNQLPYYAPSQGDTSLTSQNSPEQVSPEQDNQLRQLELVSMMCYISSIHHTNITLDVYPTICPSEGSHCTA